MEKKTKREKETEKTVEEKEKPNSDSDKKSYYYDDAHGYETYDPNEDEEKDEN